MATDPTLVSADRPDTPVPELPPGGGAMGKAGFAWASFEGARNPYYILIIIYVFAPYFARDIIGSNLLAGGTLDHLGPEAARAAANAQGQATIASMTKWAGIIAALTAPFLGAALDRGGRRKPALAIPTLVMVLCSYGLWWARPGDAGLSVFAIQALLVAAGVAFTYSEVIHNSMLSAAGAPQRLSMISGLGLALGNLVATVVFMALTVLFVLPDTIHWPWPSARFGIDTAAFEHMRITGPICAIILAVGSINFFVNGRDPGTPGASWTRAARDGVRAVGATLREARKEAQLMKFLAARMFYQDAMVTLLGLGAVYVALFLGWGFLEMLCYAIFASAWAFAGGIFGGWLDQRIGVKQALASEIVIMVVTMVFQLSITRDGLLFGLIDNYQVWDGLVFRTLSDIAYLLSISVVAVTVTASISSSRAMLVTLAPPGRSGEFFGLYAIAGTVTVWLGPMLVEAFTLWSGDQRTGMASVSLLFTIGLVVLLSVRMPRHAATDSLDSSVVM